MAIDMHARQIASGKAITAFDYAKRENPDLTEEEFQRDIGNSARNAEIAAAAAEIAKEIIDSIPDLIRETVARELAHSLLTADTIDNTEQVVVFEDGEVKRIEHRRGEETVRTDTFTISDDEITEERTVPGIGTLTITTDPATLTTTATYTPPEEE